ncbi:hypothetical protein F5879DRAFT_1040781 [Lentinula edodes]|nr:hypothetical protein F5879DRAFT_1040781 [Lentinula edodes]
MEHSSTEFGHGLSYTTFKYSQLTISGKTSKDTTSVMETAEPFVGCNGSNSLYDILFTVSAKISNTGQYTGSEVAQLYISIPEERRPIHVLRGFDKVKDIKPGASAQRNGCSDNAIQTPSHDLGSIDEPLDPKPSFTAVDTFCHLLS